MIVYFILKRMDKFEEDDEAALYGLGVMFWPILVIISLLIIPLIKLLIRLAEKTVDYIFNMYNKEK